MQVVYYVRDVMWPSLVCQGNLDLPAFLKNWSHLLPFPFDASFWMFHPIWNILHSQKPVVVRTTTLVSVRWANGQLEEVGCSGREWSQGKVEANKNCIHHGTKCTRVQRSINSFYCRWSSNPWQEIPNGHINPYYWVDEHASSMPYYMENYGSLDPRTNRQGYCSNAISNSKLRRLVNHDCCVGCESCVCSFSNRTLSS